MYSNDLQRELYALLVEFERLTIEEAGSYPWRELLGIIDSWYGRYTFPDSQIPALRDDLLSFIEDGLDGGLIYGLAYALMREIWIIAGAYCNAEIGPPAARLPEDVPPARYLLALIGDGTAIPDALYSAVPAAFIKDARVLVINNGTRGERPAAKGVEYCYLREPLGYAQIYAMLCGCGLAETIVLSGGGALPCGETFDLMLEQAGRSERFFFTAANQNTNSAIAPRRSYYDCCPPWEFQMFSRNLIDAGLFPDAALCSLDYLRQAFIEQLADSGAEVLTFADPKINAANSPWRSAGAGKRTDRWRFNQLTKHEPLAISESVLVANALRAIEKSQKSLIVVEPNTTLHFVLQDAAKNKMETSWQIYDKSESMYGFAAKLEEAVAASSWDAVVFCLPISSMPNFERIVSIVARSVSLNGTVMYYDENPFFAGRLPIMLSDNWPGAKPRHSSLTLYFRKRLRDILFDAGFEVGFERYQPPLTAAEEEIAQSAANLFPSLEGGILNNLSTKMFFCEAVRNEIKISGETR